jgi:hypothetical protein
MAAEIPEEPKIMPTHQHQCIAHCDPHLLPPLSGLIANGESPLSSIFWQRAESAANHSI